MLKHIRLLIIIIPLLAISCANIIVDSEPPGADVWINNRYFGQTPTAPINIKRKFPITITKDNYEPFHGTITRSHNSPFKVALEKIPEKPKERAGNVLIKIGLEDGGIMKESVYAETEVIERSPNVKAVRRITNLSENSWLGDFQISPSGENLIFSIYEEEKDEKLSSYSNLWSANAFSSGPMRRITQGKYFDQTPSFSPDGEQIFFSSNRLDSFDIWRLSFLAGSGIALITSSSNMQEDYPSINQVNDIILFSSEVKGSKIKQIWTLNNNSGELLQLREGRWPIWFHDKIVFSAIQRTTGEWKIWIMEKDGSSPIQISTSDGSNDIQPVISPDGRFIAFASDRALSGNMRNYDIWLSDIDGKNLIQLTTNGSRDDNPIFSPNGQTIYFRSNRGIKWDIWAMDLGIK